MSNFSEIQSLLQLLQQPDREVRRDAMLDLIPYEDTLTSSYPEYSQFFITVFYDYLDREGKDRIGQELSRFSTSRGVRIGVESSKINIKKEALILASQLFGQSNDHLEMEIYEIIESFLENDVDVDLKRPTAVALIRAGNWLDELDEDDISIRNKAKTILQNWVIPYDYHNLRLSKIINLVKGVDVELEKQISEVNLEVKRILEKNITTYEQYYEAENYLTSMYQEVYSSIETTIMNQAVYSSLETSIFKLGKTHNNLNKVIKYLGYIMFFVIILCALFFVGAWLVLFIVSLTISLVILLLYLIYSLILILWKSILILFAFVFLLLSLNWILNLIIVTATKFNLIVLTGTRIHKIALLTIGIAVIIFDYSNLAKLKEMAIQEFLNFLDFNKISYGIDIITSNFRNILDGANQWILTIEKNLILILFSIILIGCVFLVTYLIYSLILQAKLKRLTKIKYDLTEILHQCQQACNMR